MDLCERDDGVILVTDQVPSVNAFAPDGERVGRGRPSLNGAHGIALGRGGEIYLAEIDPSFVTKLTPLLSAAPPRLLAERVALACQQRSAILLFAYK